MKKYVLFDFDGVIVDSFAPAFEVAQMKCPHLDGDEYRRRFEGNINDHKELPDAHTQDCKLDLDFFEHYVPKMEEVSLVPGMREIIEQLAQAYTLIIVSSTITMPIQKLLKKHGVEGYFVEVMGNDVHKSKVEKVKMIFDKYQTAAESCVFITDTLGDMREAAALNVAAIGVTWGFHTSKTLEKGSAHRVVNKPEDIVAAVKSYFG